MKKIKDISSTGFKAPVSYFEGVEDSVFARLKADSLKEMSDDHGFDAPVGYFDTIESKVLDKLNVEETKVISIFSRRKLYYVSGIAAAIVILLAVFLNRNSTTVDELDYEVVESYIINQNISTYEIASLLTEEELEEVDLNFIEDEMNSESLEYYLLDKINLEDIIEQ